MARTGAQLKVKHSTRYAAFVDGDSYTPVLLRVRGEGQSDGRGDIEYTGPGGEKVSHCAAVDLTGLTMAADNDQIRDAVEDVSVLE